MYKYEFVDNYIEYNKYFSTITTVNPNYTKIEFRWEGYCKNICSFYFSLFKSNKKGYVVIDVLDLIPTLLKCDKLLNWFKKNKYIEKKSSNIKEKIYQTNSKIFNNVVVLKKRIRMKVINFIKKYKYECRIGLHYRSNDGCIISNHCEVHDSVINRIINVLYNLTNCKKCWLFLSSANSKFIEKLSTKYNKTVIYLPNVYPQHSAKVYDNTSIDKTVGDMIFASMTDYLITNEYSTYSKLILYMFYKNKKFDKTKNKVKFIQENGEIIESEKYTYLTDDSRNTNCIDFPPI